MEKMSNFLEKFKDFINEKAKTVSSEMVGWLAIVVLHAATLPSLLALMTGLTDNTPALDIVLMLWIGLILMFFKSVIQKDVLNILTISIGFMIQAMLMALIFFK
jgi:hypothetical protein